MVWKNAAAAPPPPLHMCDLSACLSLKFWWHISGASLDQSFRGLESSAIGVAGRCGVPDRSSLAIAGPRI